ncbi:MAG: hypothetical protein LBO03_02260 [Acidaminococcales bacterium]|jgi:hypothetical protein|nr:hypothetical protein [Acidaminococcales bacterium]
MKQFLRMKSAAALIAGLAYLGFALLNARFALPLIRDGFARQLADSAVAGLKERVEKLNYEINENVRGRNAFVTLHGFVQRVLDKNEENNFEVAKDTAGFGHFIWFQREVWLDKKVLDRTVKLKSLLPGKTNFTVVLALDRVVKGYTTFERGLPNTYINERADLFLDGLRKNGIDYFDLRDRLDSAGSDKSALFFKTDHHWQIETAFWAYTELAKFLRQNHGFSADDFYLDKNNYNFITYKKHYLGSMGRKTGLAYMGADDFTVIYPKFKTDYVYTWRSDMDNADKALSGRFETALLAPLDHGHADFFDNGDKYFTYLYGNPGLAHIVNKNNRDGSKLLFVKDSFAPPVAAFLSLLCSEVWLIDPRWYEGEIGDFVAGGDFDHVFLFLSPSLLDSAFFTFCADDAAQTETDRL